MPESVPNYMTRRLNRREFIKRTAAAGVSLPVGRTIRAAAASMPDQSEFGARAHLFLDDENIAEMQGLRRVLHQPRKEGLIQEADGRPWELGDQMSVVRDLSGRFHMTYRFHWPDPSVRDLHPNIGPDKAHWFRQTTAYANSKDGIRWTKPVLGIMEGPTSFRPAPESKWADGVFFEPSGFSRQNNLGYPISGIQDLTLFGGVQDQKRRYLLNALRYSDTHPFAEIADAGLYFARDIPDAAKNPRWRERVEVVWEGRRRGPRGPGVRVAGFDQAQRLWFECAQGSFGKWLKRGGRDIGHWTSTDLQEWSPEELVLPIADDESRAPEDYVEYMDIRVLRVADVWLGQLIIFHGDRTSPQYEMPTARGVWRKGTTEMRLIVSRDAGKTWRRVCGKEIWLQHHPQDDGYDRLVFTGSPVRVGDEFWLYYGCWDGDHLVWNKDGTTFYKNRTRIGRTARATLRWNGFASLQAGQSGQLVTKPLAPQGRFLAVNAAATRGAIRVGLQDLEGHRIPGFQLSDCKRLTGNGIAQRVRWRGRREIPPSLLERPLRLCFEVQQSDLFGFEWQAGIASEIEPSA